MHSELSTPQVQSMPHPIDRDEHRATVQTCVWLDEHDWLHRIFKSPHNTSPRFRLPDLLSACVSMALADSTTQQQMVEIILTRPTRPDAKCERRSCHIFPTQFEQVMDAHRAPWNRFPNPMFELDHITTACVTVVTAWPVADARVLAQARANLLARTRASASTGTGTCTSGLSTN